MKASFKVLVAACSCSIFWVPPAHSDSPWLKSFSQRVVSEGRSAELPPHLSLVLGLGDGEKPVAVKQAGKREPPHVRTFNVAPMQSQQVVVLLDYNEDTQVTRALLLRINGQLLRGVTYKTGSQPQPLPESQARASQREQLKYWANEAVDKTATPTPKP